METGSGYYQQQTKELPDTGEETLLAAVRTAVLRIVWRPVSNRAGSWEGILQLQQEDLGKGSQEMS